MGCDPDCVKGAIDAWRIIDASIVPAVSSTNTNAPTITIAEKGAAIIWARHGKGWRREPPIRSVPLTVEREEAYTATPALLTSAAT